MTVLSRTSHFWPSYEATQILLDANVNRNKQSLGVVGKSMAPLYYAFRQREWRIAELLLFYGPNADDVKINDQYYRETFPEPEAQDLIARYTRQENQLTFLTFREEVFGEAVSLATALTPNVKKLLNTSDLLRYVTEFV